MDVSINCIRASVVIRSKAVKDDREGLDGKGAPYAEVLNTKLDPVNGLSSSYYKTSDIDVNIAKSAIYVGGLFSDFVKV